MRPQRLAPLQVLDELLIEPGIDDMMDNEERSTADEGQKDIPCMPFAAACMISSPPDVSNHDFGVTPVASGQGYV